MTRIKRVESEREMELEIDDFETRGYRIKEQSNYSAKVKAKDWGDLPIHGFLFIFAFLGAAVLFNMATLSGGGAWLVAIIANATYAAYSWITAEKVVIKVDPAQNQTR